MKQLSLVFIITFIIFSLNLNSSVTHIWPSSGTNDTTRSVHIFGGGFNGGITNVTLQKLGYPKINAINITVINDNYLTCDFILTGVLTTTYNLIVNTDTLDMCFTVNHLFNYSQSFWNKTDLGFGVSWMRDVVVGDGNNDGELEVYGACSNNYIYQFKWNGSSWDKTDLGSGGWIMAGVAVEDGNNDGQLEVYAACWDDHIYQFKWNGTNWIKTDLGSGLNRMYAVVVGDGNCTGSA